MNATTIPGTPPLTDEKETPADTADAIGPSNASNAKVRHSSGACNMVCVGVTPVILACSAALYWAWSPVVLPCAPWLDVV